jgi:anaerobic magnesium-protoporphyrin IX monomethyl ester cyclase
VYTPLNRPKVIFIAQNQPLNNDVQFQQRMAGAAERAKRQSHRFPGLDLSAMQAQVHENTRASLLFMEGRYMDLLDLMNYVKAGCRPAKITPDNVTRHYSLANTVTLNGIYMHQYLKAHGYDPIIIQNYATGDLEGLLQESPLAVCISSNFILMNDIKEMAVKIKTMAPDVAVIAGGMLVKKAMHAGENLTKGTLEFLSTFHEKVDAFVVEAKGEQSLVKLLKALENGDDLSNVPNLAYFDEKGRVTFTARLEEEIHMDETAIDWHKIPKAYLRHTLPVNSSRGCYYRCRFCTYHWLFPQVNYRSLEVLRQELKAVESLGFVRHVRFTDDNFTAKAGRIKAVLDMMIHEKFSFSWSSFARASALTPELVKLMKQSGCEFVDLGLESGSQTILDNMDKHLSCQQSLDAIGLLNDHGIISRGSFIIGYPGETRDTFFETIDFINESGLPYYQPYLFYYTANTLVHEERKALNLRGLGLAWAHETMDSVEASHLLMQMIDLIPESFTDGQSYVEEIYKMLRGEGYTQEDIKELFRLKRQLQLTLREHPSAGPSSLEIAPTLKKMGGLIS